MKPRRAASVLPAVLMSGMFVLAWSSGPSAQDRRLLDPNGYVRDDAYARPLVPAADQKYLKIDGLKMKDLVKEVVAISLKSRDDGNKYCVDVISSHRLTARGESLASHRDGRGAPPARRDDREYREYLSEEQRSRRGCIARRLQPDFHHGLLKPSRTNNGSG